MRGHDNHGQQIDAHQRRTANQQRQAFQRTGMFTWQFWQQFNQANQCDQRAHTDSEEGGAPAEVLPDDAANRQTQHHRQRRSGRNQAQRLSAFARRGETNGERRGDRPEHGMRKCDPHTANDQHGKVPGHKRQHMAGDKHHEQANQQFSPLHLAGQ